MAQNAEDCRVKKKRKHEPGMRYRRKEREKKENGREEEKKEERKR